MPDDSTLRLNIQVDGVGNVQAGMKAAADAVNGGARSIAAALIAQGESAQAAESALINLGYSAKEAAAVIAEFAGAANTVVGPTDRAAASISGLDRAMAQASVRIAASEAGLGSLGFALGRVASQSSTLGPILSAAFPVVGIAAFATIIVDLAEKVYKLYQNIVLLKANIDALDKAGMEIADHQARLNYEYEVSVARLSENREQFAAARSEYQKAAADKPLELLDLRKAIEDKNAIKSYSDELRNLSQSALTIKDADSAIGVINRELKSTEGQLTAAKNAAQGLNERLAEAPEAAFGLSVAQSRADALVTDLTKKIDVLKGAIAEIQSQTGIAANAAKEQDIGISKREARDENKEAEALRRAGEAAVKQQEEVLLAMKAEHALSVGEEVEYWATLAAASIQGSIPYLNAVKREQELFARLNEEVVRAETESGNRLIQAKKAVDEAFIKEILFVSEQEKKAQTEAREAAEAQVHLAESIATKTLEAATKIDNERLALHEITLRKWLGQEQEALTAWYEAERAALQKAMVAFEAAGQTETQQYRELKNKELEIDQQFSIKSQQIEQQVVNKEVQEMQKGIGQISAAFNTGINQWIEGHKKLGAALAQVWDSLVVKAADAVAKIAENFLIGLVLQQGAQEKQVLMDAKTAAANAWANAPNPIIGAIEAATTFAAVVAAYTPSFAEGGIVNANLHDGEMVLPRHISTFIQSAAAGASGAPGVAGLPGLPGAPGAAAIGGDTNITHHQRNNFELHVHGGKADKNSVIEWVRQGIREGSIGLT